MTGTLITTIEIILIGLFCVAVVVSVIGLAAPLGARRADLSMIGIVTSIILVVVLTVTTIQLDGAHVHDVAVSQKEAAGAAVYANTMKSPTTPTQANDTMTVATDDVATRDGVKITFSDFAKYRYDVVSSSSVGTNVSSVCVSYDVASRTWSSSQSNCQDTRS